MFLPLRVAVSTHALALAAGIFMPYIMPAAAQSGPAADDPQSWGNVVIVTATTYPDDPPVVAEARKRLSETPGAVAVISAESYADRHAVTLVDVLRDVPGVFVQKKWGGDARLSIRGSGVGQNFHLRGTLVAQDGIPLNEADGFGDTQFVDPSLARYTEVHKGGNALRYGGAMLGGAINIVTPNGKTMADPRLIRIEVGDFGTLRGHAEAGGQSGGWDGFVAASGYKTNGWRDHSEGAWQFGTANMGYTFGDERELRARVTGGYIHQEIPGSISFNQALMTPKMANAGNLAGNHQRDQGIARGVVQTRWRFDANTVLEGGVFATWKNLDHPIFQVIDQESRNWGVLGRIDWTGEFLGRPSDLFYGVSYRSGDLDANQWINIAGSPGAQTAESSQDAKALDVFVEGRIFILDGFALVAGGSFGRAERDFESYPPSSVVVADSETYEWFAPRVGFIWQNEQGAQVYGNVTRSVEPPTFGALAPTSGGFQPLKEQDARSAEIGARGRTAEFVWDVAYYYADIENEILTFGVNPGQGIPATTFNALDGTVHQGIEAGLDWQLSDEVRLRQTYMWSDFEFTGDRQYGDNNLPIVPEHFYRAELKWTAASGFWLAPSVEWSMSDAWVDYANTFGSPSYAIFNISTGYAFDGGAALFVDVRNLFDERYISNFTPLTNWSTATDAQRMVFFPGDGRAIYGGVAFAF